MTVDSAIMMVSLTGRRHWAKGADHDHDEWRCFAAPLIEAEWKPLALYGTNAALTYLEDAPAGRGPWFIVGNGYNGVDQEEFAEYDVARARFYAITAPTACWIITKDLLADKSEPEGTNLNAVGVIGPRDTTPDQIAQLQAGKGRAFRMYDDDDEHYYSGRFIGDDDSEDGFFPLEQFGTPNAGCTRIDYGRDGGKWVTL